MFLFNEFIKSTKQVTENERTISLSYGNDTHSIHLKTKRITLSYNNEEYLFEKETQKDLSFDQTIWHFNGGKYTFFDKKTGKKTQMIKIRTLNMFFLETFKLSSEEAKEYSGKFSFLLDDWVN